MNKNIPTKIYLTEQELPKQWYNMNAILPEKHQPALNPATLKPCTLSDFENVFCTELAKQELNVTDEYIDIPDDERWIRLPKYIINSKGIILQVLTNSIRQ